MKIPKLKHPYLCKTLLYLPALLFFPAIGLLYLPEWLGWSPRGLWMLLILFATGGMALYYLLHNFPLLLGIDVLSASIHAWQRDRLEFSSRINGETRKTARPRKLRRCCLWGRKWKDGSDERFTIYYKHGYSWSVFRSMIEKRIVLCEAEHLTAEQLHILLGQAQARLRELPDGKVRFQTRRVKKEPRAYCTMIVILADRVDEDVKTKARQLPVRKDDICVLPCAVECPTGHYYMDGGKEGYFVGMGPRPARNFCRGMARRLVFAFGLPRKNPDKRPPYENAVDPESSLWEFVREMRKGLKDSKDEKNKEIAAMLRTLANGKVKVGEYGVYCKQNDRIAAWGYVTHEEDEKTISLLQVKVWYYQKGCFRHSLLFHRELNKRKMSAAQVKETDRRIRAALAAEGWKIADGE